ncbi:Pentapeptide repeat-containing protein [Saccharopolyspora antimicrobica]|uniref:Pentapeptide repeat protein n=1 Tax=Saccharopolyspora antimicrobica TaxID=455193 RepID=A0A1I4TN81_9PSEU|nr:pentapeptide repeat-containing protein [Saccharopolyspora antimicrobica]RKT88483.1 pentapeptide repeat protein [Saccharopolyspora antimicrobica]SFM78208.1 Pentapeptide repeat-containing protein [Saccharopolyspora antimicrobica]
MAVPQYVASQTTLESTRSQSLNTQEQQITERFGRAVEQLGTRDNLEVRIGGIYALERIARDSPPDHPAVVNLLTTFVHERTKVLRDAQRHCPDQPLSADVQAALSVLARRNAARDDPASHLNLANACLWQPELKGLAAPFAIFTAADLTGAFLDNADLRLAYLVDADLDHASLTGADLRGADLSGVDFLNADLSGADLRGADLTNTRLDNAKLTNANLDGTKLNGADLSGADLVNASLRSSDLTDAYLSGANLTDVKGLTREQTAAIAPGGTAVQGVPLEWLPR